MKSITKKKICIASLLASIVIALCCFTAFGGTVNASANTDIQDVTASSGVLNSVSSTLSYSDYSLNLTNPASGSLHVVKYFSTDPGSGVGITASKGNRMHTFIMSPSINTQNIKFLYDNGTLSRGTTYYAYFYEAGGAETDTTRWSNSVSILVAPLQIALPPDPVKEGHTFIGWYMDSTFNTPYSGQPIYENTSLYAKFEVHKLTHTLVLFNGTGTSSLVSNWGTAISPTIPVREGYEFLGWQYEGGAVFSESTILKENTTLLAQWKQIVFVVTFYLNNEVHATVNVPYGLTLGEALEQAKLFNYKLSSVKLENGEALESGSLAVTGNMAVELSEKPILEKVTSSWKKYLGITLGVLSVIALTCCITLPKKKRKLKTKV